MSSSSSDVEMQDMNNKEEKQPDYGSDVDGGFVGAFKTGFNGVTAHGSLISSLFCGCFNGIWTFITVLFGAHLPIAALTVLQIITLVMVFLIYKEVVKNNDTDDENNDMLKCLTDYVKTGFGIA